MLHSNTLSHVVRRGFDVASTDNPQNNPMDVINSMSPGGAALILITLLLFTFALFSVRYTLIGVVATLAQVEQPTHSYVALSPTGPKPFNSAGEPVPPDPEIAVVQSAAITSSIRATLRHLTTIAGFRARFRGLACAACIALVYQMVYHALGALLMTFLPFLLASLLTGVFTHILLARWAMAWTHIVISEPSPLAWYKRVPSFATWRKIWAPTAISALAQQLAFIVPAALWFGMGLNDSERLQKSSAVAASWKILAVLLTGVFVFIDIVIPAQVALTRCQASLLPDEDESIVPFDRFYGGKVVPAIIGGSGMISYFDAWRSFDRPARARLVKLYLKIFGVDVALHVLFGLVLTLQLWLVLGKDMERVGGGAQTI